MQNPVIDQVREVVRELSGVLLELPVHSAPVADRLGRILDRCSEELAEAAAAVRES